MEFLTAFVICKFSSQLLPAHICVREEFCLDIIHVWYKNYLGILTFKGLMLDISNTACTPQWPNVLYISNAVHALSWVGNTNKLVVDPTTRPGIRQEQWCHLWQSGFQHYLCAHLTFGDQLREWKAQHSRPLFWGWNVEPQWRWALASLLAAFVEVWCVLILCSGGLAYTWRWIG